MHPGLLEKRIVNLLFVLLCISKITRVKIILPGTEDGGNAWDTGKCGD
jgi:hypothetical protein